MWKTCITQHYKSYTCNTPKTPHIIYYMFIITYVILILVSDIFPSVTVVIMAENVLFFKHIKI